MNTKRYLKETTEGQALLHQLFREEMPAWLMTEDGQDWLARISDEAGFARVLIVVNGDGYLEAFSEGKVAVRFAEVACDQRGAGGKLHQKCQDIALSLLPKTWQRIWQTGKARATHFFAKTSPARLISRKISQMHIEALQAASDELCRESDR